MFDPNLEITSLKDLLALMAVTAIGIFYTAVIIAISFGIVINIIRFMDSWFIIGGC